jgi:hypothetical protein
VPVVPSCLLEPAWVEFSALLEERGGHRAEFQPDHPLGCHRRRVPARVVFEHVIAALVHGSGYELRRCTERNAKIVDFYLYLAAALVTIRQLIQRARNRYRWDTRPTTKRLPEVGFDLVGRPLDLPSSRVTGQLHLQVVRRTTCPRMQPGSWRASSSLSQAVTWAQLELPPEAQGSSTAKSAFSAWPWPS